MKEWINKGKETLNSIIRWVKIHPSSLGGVVTAAIAIYLQFTIIGLCVAPIDIISEDMAPTVLATGAQIIAGLYGLTLTGYIFFLDRLQNQGNDEEMLEDIIALLKKRYHNLVLILSIVVLCVILISLAMLLYNRESQWMPDYVYHFLVYESMLFIFIAVTLIIYFVIMIVDPDKIKRASIQYKKKMSRNDEELGSLQEFLRDYEAIEQLLREKSESLTISQIGTNPWKTMRHLKGKELVEVRNRLSDPLMKKITMVSQYYNYMVFSQEMTVSKEMCDMAREVRETLEKL